MTTDQFNAKRAEIEDADDRQHWVSIILVNGVDCISDYSFANHNADTFRAVMEKHVDQFVEALQ